MATSSPDHLELFVETKQSDAELNRTLWAVCTALGPKWQGVKPAEIQVDLVKGGITNLLYKVTSPAGVLLVRVYGDKTELVIDRSKETAMLQQLSELGFSVAYHGSFGNGRVEEWRDVRALKPTELFSQSPVDFPDMIAEQLVRMHSLRIVEPGNPSSAPQLFNIIDKWVSTVQSINFDDVEARKEMFARMDVPGIVEEYRWLQKVLPSGSAAPLGAEGTSAAAAAARFAFTSVLCHNDMLCGNILVDSHNQCQLIDFEYGCYNFRAFDIANHFVEYAGFDGDWGKWHPTEDQMMHFLKAYVKHAVKTGALSAFADAAAEDEFLREVLKWTSTFCLASHLFWGFWSIVQARHSPIDFDFLNYARMRFVGYYYCKGLYARALFPH